MELTTKHHEYWRKNLVITAILLLIWFIATFVEGWYARELNAFSFLGFPLGYYVAAQGSIVVFLVESLLYAKLMNAKDLEYGIREEGA